MKMKKMKALRMLIQNPDAMKENINKFDYIKKSHCKTQIYTNTQGEYFVAHVEDKSLISVIQKELLN